MFALSVIVALLVLLLPFLGNAWSSRSLRAMIEHILSTRHREFLRGLKLGRTEPVGAQCVDSPPDYISIDGVVLPYPALLQRTELLKSLNDPELDALVEQLQRRWWHRAKD